MINIAPWLVGAFMVFALGVFCGGAAAWKRYARALDVRDAEARKEGARLADYMISGVQFNASILTILDERKAQQVAVDWELLVHAANGAGFALVKATPNGPERTH